MKILHWPTGYPDPEYGTPYDLIFIQEHIRSIGDECEQVVFFLSPLEPRRGQLLDVRRTNEAGIKVIRIHVKRYPAEILQRLLVYCVVLIEILCLIISGFRPDIIHVHIFSSGKIPAFLAKLLRIPLVVTEHWSALCLEGRLTQERLADARKVYESASIVLPVSTNLYHCIEKNTGKAYPYKVIHNSVDCSIFYGAEKNRSEVSGSSAFRLLTVARLEEVKDIPTMLQSVAILCKRGLSIHLTVVGKGDPGSLMVLSQHLGISSQVNFVGQQPKPVIADLMRASDVFILSSLWENSPCVIGEAICCGLPVVVTAVGGVPELIDSPILGRLVPPKDPEALADAISDVVTHLSMFDRKLISKIGSDRFSTKMIGKQIRETYQEVLQSKNRAT